MDYAGALRYIDSFTDLEKKMGHSYSSEIFDLQRPRELLRLLGEPHLSFPSVLVAGTKGKGSTAAMIASVLQASGRRTGLYTQPHLHTFRERIRVDGRLISPWELAEVVDAVAAAVDELRKSRPDLGSLTTYEVATAASFSFFAKGGLDLAVLEVGLGGRLDTTNLVEPLISVITPISLDHQQILGTTIPLIAAEKAGIIKAGGLVVTSEQTEEAMKAILRAASERNATVLVARPQVVEEFDEVPTGAEWTPSDHARLRRERVRVTLRGPSGTPYRLELPLLGAHQVSNASTAIAVLELLGVKGFPLERETVERGLAVVRWPGRLEVLNREPLVIADGAHNGDSSQKLASALRSEFLYTRMILVLGTSSDKNVEAIVAPLAAEASTVITTRSDHPRAADPERLAVEARLHCSHVEIAANLSAALNRAVSLASPADLICVTGSLFTVAGAREIYGLAEETE